MRNRDLIRKQTEQRRLVVARYFHHIVFNKGKEGAYRLAAAEFDSEEAPLSPRTVARWVKQFERWGEIGLRAPAWCEKTGRECDKRDKLKLAGYTRKEINQEMRQRKAWKLESRRYAAKTKNRS